MDRQIKTPFETALAALTGLGESSVWSLIVTVIGDQAGDGGVIAGPVLAEILEPMGVRPEALRVALHRLRKDGWIVSTKTGRIGTHRLTEFGMAETRIAALRIYQRHVSIPATWYLLIGEKETNLSAIDDVLSLGRGIYLGSGVAPVREGYLVMQGDAPVMPEWLKTQLGWDNLTVSYSHLSEALRVVNDSLTHDQQLLPKQIATLRTLIVHHWRRNLLKHPDLPLGFFPTGWQGENSRKLVLDLLDRLALNPNTTPASRRPQRQE